MTVEVAKGIVRLQSGSSPGVDLGFRPRALVLWWCREHPPGGSGGIGFATDGSGEASTAWAADDALIPEALSRWGADTALLLFEDPRSPHSAPRGRARFEDNGFSLVCDRTPERPWLIHYLALGGSHVSAAAVRCLPLDEKGRLSVSGLGFPPGLVLATAGAGAAASGPQEGLAVAFGGASGPRRQVAGGFAARAEGGQTFARGAQRDDALAVLPAPVASGGSETLTRLVSLDRDGFTLETTNPTSELSLAVLALSGGRFTVGLGTATSRSTPVGFEPAGALLFGTGLGATPVTRDIGRLCLGGFSPPQQAGCVSWSVRRRGAWPPAPRSRSSPDGVFEVIDTTPGGLLHARAELSGVGRSRYSLAWPIRDPYRRDFGYVAFGTARAKRSLLARMRSIGRGGSLRG